MKKFIVNSKYNHCSVPFSGSENAVSVVHYAGLVYSAIDLEEINDVTNLGCVQCSLLKFKYDFLQYVQHLPKRIKKKKSQNGDFEFMQKWHL